MANKVDVFTEELSKMFTILQQQYVMIKYMKALITSGELDETEINKLKEQITAINNNIDTIINDQIVPIKQNILHIEEGMSEFEKVMPTDINTDSDGNLILEHDGIEITGQKKNVKIYDRTGVDNIVSDKVDKITSTGDNRVYGISSRGTQTNYSVGWYVSNLLADYIARYNDTGRLTTPTPQSNTDCANKKYVDDAIANVGGEGSQLFRHIISIYNNDSSICFVFEYITDSNLKVDSIQDLNKITHASAGTNILCSVLNAGQNFSLNTDCNGIHFNGSNWQYGFVVNDTIFSEHLLTIGNINDIVTTI